MKTVTQLERAWIGNTPNEGVRLWAASPGLAKAEARELKALVSYCGSPPAGRPWEGSLIVHTLKSSRLAVLHLRPTQGEDRRGVRAGAAILTPGDYAQHFYADPFVLQGDGLLALPEHPGGSAPESLSVSSLTREEPALEARWHPSSSSSLAAALLEHVLLHPDEPLHVVHPADASPVLRDLWLALPLERRAGLRFATWDFRRADERAPLAFVAPEHADRKAPGLAGEPSADTGLRALRPAPLRPETRLGRRIEEALVAGSIVLAREHAEAYTQAGDAYLDLLDRFEAVERDGWRPEALPSLLAQSLALAGLPAWLPPPGLLVANVAARHPRLPGLKRALAAVDPKGRAQVCSLLAGLLERQALPATPALHLAHALLVCDWLAPDAPAAQQSVQRLLDPDSLNGAPPSDTPSTRAATRDVSPNNGASTDPVLNELSTLLLDVAVRITPLPRTWIPQLYTIARKIGAPAAQALLQRPLFLLEAFTRALSARGVPDARTLHTQHPREAARAFLDLARQDACLAADTLADLYERERLPLRVANLLLVDLERAGLTTQLFAEHLAAAAPGLAAALIERACAQPWTLLGAMAAVEGVDAIAPLREVETRLARRGRPQTTATEEQPTPSSGGLWRRCLSACLPGRKRPEGRSTTRAQALDCGTSDTVRGSATGRPKGTAAVSSKVTERRGESGSE